MTDLSSLPLDAETKVMERPNDHKNELRLWLRFFSCNVLIEGEIRRRLRDKFGITLPRFDLLAQLDKASGGMKLGELSRRLMVSNGNVTGLVERLVTQGLVDRQVSASDRRSHLVKLTPEGRRSFRAMAAAHETWVAEIFDDLSASERDMLMRLLAKVKASALNAATKA